MVVIFTLRQLTPYAMSYFTQDFVSGRIEEAVQQYRQAMRIQQNHTVAIVNAARSLRALKNNREAEQLYKR